MSLMTVALAMARSENDAVQHDCPARPGLVFTHENAIEAEALGGPHIIFPSIGVVYGQQIMNISAIRPWCKNNNDLPVIRS